jgi:hypothetical protein
LKHMSVDNFNWFLHIMLFLHTKKVIERQEEKRRRLVEDEDEDEEESDIEE